MENDICSFVIGVVFMEAVEAIEDVSEGVGSGEEIELVYKWFLEVNS